MALHGKRIIVAVTGGIAAFKAAELTSRLKKAGAEVRVAMTAAAEKFVAPLTFEAISGHPVYRSVFDQPLAYRMEHIEWARWGEALVIAPASTDFIARMAAGLGDDAPTTLYLAYDGDTFIAPAMNTKMWEHPATRKNIALLEERGVKVLGPGSGNLACGEVGEGRMIEPETIVNAIAEYFASSDEKKPLSGETVLITAGPTREPLDPIRFISNRSTGKMGTALAAEARRLGARVIFIHGPLAAPLPSGVESVPTEDSRAMLEAVQKYFPSTTIAIFAAAVANYRAPSKDPNKIKGGETLELKLVRTEDIAAWAGSHRNGSGQLVIGFAAESQNLIEAAKEKLRKKNLDLIFANPIGVEGVGFEAEGNSVIMIDREGKEIESGVRSKADVADWIWGQVLARRKRRE